MAWEELFFRVPCLRRIPPTWSCHGSRLSGDPVSHHNNANKESLPMPCAKHICTHIYFISYFYVSNWLTNNKFPYGECRQYHSIG